MRDRKTMWYGGVFLCFFLLTMLVGQQVFAASPGLETVELPNPLGQDVTIPVLVGNIIKAGLGILGSVSLVAFIYGGFLWLVSAGSAERVDKGFKTMIYAAIGIFVVFASYGILITIISGLG